jgi:biopolymer transport protein ExbD
MRKLLLAAPFAALFVIASAVPDAPPPSRGLAARIATLGRCGDSRQIVLQVGHSGRVRINQEQARIEGLPHRLEEIFRTRAYRYAYVTADPDVRFGDVANAIDAASPQADYIVLITPSVLRRLTFTDEGDTCLDPNLPQDYWRHPPR